MSPSAASIGAMPGSPVGIIGFGRFGRLWATLLRDHFPVRVFDPRQELQREPDRITVGTLGEVLECRTIFYAVPISTFEAVLSAHRAYYESTSEPREVIDLLSVKLHPRQVFEKSLSPPHEALLLHPMFGPDSVAASGLAGQCLVMDRYRLSEKRFHFWRDFFSRLGLRVIELTADEHDRLAARSQGVTHFIGRVLEEFKFEATAIDTLGAKKLFEIKAQVCNDTPQLFQDLQYYNPYTREMRVDVGYAVEKLYNRLIPNRLTDEVLVVGIQGGRGSFNEEAARYYLGRSGVTDYRMEYLYTTENVLRALHEGRIDRGQFAMHNSLGGIVHESVHAMSRYNFHIVEEFAIKISHALMIRKDVPFSAVDTIMTHPQVLRQCRENLLQKYQNLKQQSGEGELIDHSRVAELLSRGELPSTIAVMGSKVLADIYGLEIVEDNLQDLHQNFTSFLWVERPGSSGVRA